MSAAVAQRRAVSEATVPCIAQKCRWNDLKSPSLQQTVVFELVYFPQTPSHSGIETQKTRLHEQPVGRFQIQANDNDLRIFVPQISDNTQELDMRKKNICDAQIIQFITFGKSQQAQQDLRNSRLRWWHVKRLFVSQLCGVRSRKALGSFLDHAVSKPHVPEHPSWRRLWPPWPNWLRRRRLQASLPRT